MAYWIETGIPARLAIMPRPNGGRYLEDEMRALQREGAGVLVSLLTPEEEIELDLQDERAACSAYGLSPHLPCAPHADSRDPRAASLGRGDLSRRQGVEHFSC